MQGIKEKFYRPNGILSWIVCAGCFINLMIVGGIDTAFGQILASILEVFGTDRKNAGLVASIHGSMLNLGAFICSLLTQSQGISFRALIFCGGGIYCLSFLASYFSPNLFFLI